MPVITQSRSLVGKRLRTYFRDVDPNVNPSPAPRLNDPTYLPDGDQVTTSYRGPRGSRGQDSEYEAMSGEQLNRNIRVEYQTQYDNGHDFSTLKHVLDPSPKVSWSVPMDSKGRSWRLDGGYHLTPTSYATLFPSIVTPSTSQINADGARAIHISQPTAPEVQLMAVLGELREKLPHFIGHSIVNSGPSGHNIGDEYLNVQFGIMPSVGDIQNLAKGVAQFTVQARNMQERARELHIRRHVSLGQTRSLSLVTNDNFSVGVGTFNNSNYLPFFWNGNGTKSCADIVETETWFSGAYLQHIADGYAFLGKASKYEALANKLLGTHLTVQDVWQLTPWSWLIDWFYDVNGFISNLTAFKSDSLVLKYGYIMHHVKVTRERSIRGMKPLQTSYGPSNIPSSLTMYTTTEYKNRKRSTPYGFDVNLDVLSAQRVAVLAALGLTRASKVLRVPIGQ